MTAAVSGPGPFSERTDSGGQPIRDLPDPAYGEATEYREQQKGAPLAETDASGQPAGSAGSGGAMFPGSTGFAEGETAAVEQPLPPLPGMFDDADPSIPVTEGAPAGPGANALVGMPPGPGEFTPVNFRQALEPYLLSDPTGILSEVVAALSDRGAF